MGTSQEFGVDTFFFKIKPEPSKKRAAYAGKDPLHHLRKMARKIASAF